MIQEAIETVVEGRNLTYDMALGAMRDIMNGEANEAQMGALLGALRLKGESIEEITGFAQGMREKAVPVAHEQDVFEIVGTGGDKANTFNISTTAGFVIAAGGVPVAKHGNRSVSSKCGAADCLEALGVQLGIPGEANQKVLAEVGMCFMFAPLYHSSMKYAAPVRKALGIRTVFNVLGPLTNPAGATKQLMGVYDRQLVEPLAQVLANLGVTRGAVVHGFDGLDEITACDKTYVCEINEGQLTSYILDPAEYGLPYAKSEELVGGDGAVNAAITRAILEGEKGPRRNAVLLNAGVSFHLAEPNTSIEAGLAKAARLIDEGKALAVLEALVKTTNEVVRQ
ncbi:anthranilate phosphoribosyltransferase [Veillonella sp. R32]|uniref:anthranilate phosphoribosyltransferase n=1 Tax=Veillonella sp. R32 TaxID=2021312 RepID=UPI001389960D|nr:anthranilate phosphoribosyltransferase [Veillonella sp. R32]KAF1683174.1 anthranilate phosphoribosyltransferase [Veillonella sp. R32]